MTPFPRIHFACEHCGGTQVIRDAWAEWDAERQSWVLNAVFDFAHCLDCGCDTRLVQHPAAAQG